MLGRSRTRFRLRPRGTLIPPGDGYDVASFNVGPSGEAVVLWTDGAGLGAMYGREENAGGASFPKTVLSEPVTAAISVHASGVEGRAVSLQDFTLAVPVVQPLPDGRFLAAGARAYWRESGPEQNAVVYGADGIVERRECLGDGISHVQAAADGTIWVGYNDEGVYGNFGWGMGTGPSPIGAAGIVRFSLALEVEWEYPRDLAPIDDCYVLNVADGDVWACYYSDFDVVRIRDGAVRAWTTDGVEGAGAIVVGDESVALFGGYDKDRDRLVIGQLDDDGLDVDVTGRLTMPNGRRLPQDAVVVGRGDELHVLVGLDWFIWSLADHP